MGKVVDKTEIQPIISKINKQVKNLVDSAIVKVVWEKKNFENLANAIPEMVKLIAGQVLLDYPELEKNEMETVVKAVKRDGKKEIERFFESCGKDIRKHKRKAGKKDET